MSTGATFRAIVVDRETDAGGERQLSAGLRHLTADELRSGDAAPDEDRAVLIEVEYSSLNYKDGLAVCGRPGVTRAYPIVAGIDVVGIVAESADARWLAGDRVVLNGAGLSETRHGGFGERALVEGDHLVRVPDAISSRRAAAIGTAGFTAMLSVLALERHGIARDAGPILVTGASGGVGSVATLLLSRLGYTVCAATADTAANGPYLRDLGASEILDRADLATPGKPLQSERWAAAIDSVGGIPLANVLAQTNYGGVVTACGLAASAELPATVLPFILRGVSLVGVNSVDAPLALREEGWRRLAVDLDLDRLDAVTSEIPLEGVVEAGAAILAGATRGRVVVNPR